MQLRELLDAGWKDKVAVVAVSWTEDRYGHASEGRLQRMVADFHPDIRVIRETPQINADFAPLVYVPANFLFDRNGRLIYGDGNREYLGKDKLIALFERAR